MTYSPNNNRKKRANEFNDMDHIQMTKRVRTKSFDDSDIADLKDVSCVPQSTNHNFPVWSQDKEQFHHLSFLTNNEVQRSITGNYVQSQILNVSQQNSFFHQTNFKYLPDLNANENPHYYENNKLLFELYVERLRRSTSHSASTSHQF